MTLKTRTGQTITHPEMTAAPTVRERFRVLVRVLLAQGKIPGPKELAYWMNWSNDRNISGWAAAIRREEFLRAGLTKRGDGRWVR